MDHADARSRLEEHYGDPASSAPMDAELIAHLEGCRECAAEDAALRATTAALQLTIGPPRGARERVLGNVTRQGRQRRPVATTAAAEAPSAAPAGRPIGRRRLALPSSRVLAAAAVLAVLAYLGGVLSGALLSQRPAEESRLPRAAMMMAELARQATAQTMTLRDSTGEPAGTVIFDPASRRLAVVTGSLPALADRRYGCFVERDGERTWIGPMNYEAQVHFWAGPVSEAPADLGAAGDRFVVLRDPADRAPLLAADF